MTGPRLRQRGGHDNESPPRDGAPLGASRAPTARIARPCPEPWGLRPRLSSGRLQRPHIPPGPCGPPNRGTRTRPGDGRLLRRARLLEGQPVANTVRREAAEVISPSSTRASAPALPFDAEQRRSSAWGASPRTPATRTSRAPKRLCWMSRHELRFVGGICLHHGVEDDQHLAHAGGDGAHAFLSLLEQMPR